METYTSYVVNKKLNRKNNFSVLFNKSEKILIKDFVFDRAYYSPTKFKIIIETGTTFFEKIVDLKINEELNNYYPHELNIYVDFSKSKLIIIPIEINYIYRPKEEKIICGFNSLIRAVASS